MKVNHSFNVFVSIKLQKPFLRIFEGKKSGFLLGQKADGRWLAVVGRFVLAYFLLRQCWVKISIYNLSACFL
jgi:hypothetical protein